MKIHVSGVKWPIACVGCGKTQDKLKRYSYGWEESFPVSFDRGTITSSITKLEVDTYLCESCFTRSKEILNRDIKPIRDAYMRKMITIILFIFVLPGVIFLSSWFVFTDIMPQIGIMFVAMFWYIFIGGYVYTDHSARPKQIEFMGRPSAPFIWIYRWISYDEMHYGSQPGVQNLEFFLSSPEYKGIFNMTNPLLRTRIVDKPHMRVHPDSDS